MEELGKDKMVNRIDKCLHVGRQCFVNCAFYKRRESLSHFTHSLHGFSICLYIQHDICLTVPPVLPTVYWYFYKRSMAKCLLMIEKRRQIHFICFTHLLPRGEFCIESFELILVVHDLHDFSSSLETFDECQFACVGVHTAELNTQWGMHMKIYIQIGVNLCTFCRKKS